MTDFDCSICMDILRDPVSTPCGHNFCKECLTAHIAHNARYGNYDSACPQCRATIQTRASALHVNTGLRDMIERARTAASVAPPQAPVGLPFNNAPCSLAMSHTDAPAGKFLFHCSLTPPAEGARQPIVAILGLDLSGSMGTPLPNPTNEKGALLFTRLDLAKHVCVTTAHMLGPEDILCVVGFSSNSSVTLKPTLMTEEGKSKLELAIKNLKPDGGTNIWSALQLMNKVSNKPEFTGRNIVAALLTDGEASAETSPRRGEVETYRSLVRPESLSVFGFSYDINSKLLYQLASVSNCTFGFIPDFSMVGTVFINWMAAALSTASLSRTVTVRFADGSKSVYATGLIQYGQTRNLVYLSDSEPKSFSVNESAELNSVPAEVNSVRLEALSDMANVRFELLNKLQFSMGHDGNGGDYNAIYAKYSNSSDPSVQELMRDIKPADTDDQGQVSMAVQSQVFWKKWGKHYTRAYYTAVLQETCVNFKDPGLQIYGGKLFKEISELGDKIFCELPAPEATGGVDMLLTGPPAYYGSVSSMTMALASPGPSPVSRPSQPATMASFHNAGGGCWAPGSKVRMAYGYETKPIEDIRRGDMVWTPQGAAEVEYSLVLGRESRTQLMCNYKNKLLITPWHPVLNENGAWVQPAATEPLQDTVMPVVYNLILTKGHIIDINSVLSVTLGHGFTGPVIEHGFFGNKNAILSDLSKQPGFDEGRPVYKNLKTRVDSMSGLIVGWYDAV